MDIDQSLVTFAADADWARQQGVRVERFNLAQQPMAFAENITVKALLERAGEAALPVTLVGGEIALAGRYPTRADLARWAGIPLEPAAPREQGACCAPAKAAAASPQGCCSGSKPF